MSGFDDLNDENLLIYAMKCYDKPNYLISEFEEDFKRIQYLQKLFFRYDTRKDLKERLVLNHLIVLYNIFGAEAVSRILFFKMPEKHWSQLKTFLLYLNIMPQFVRGIKGRDINGREIPIDLTIAQKLREI